MRFTYLRTLQIPPYSCPYAVSNIDVIPDKPDAKFKLFVDDTALLATLQPQISHAGTSGKEIVSGAVFYKMENVH
jgi:hypothetical protein